MASQPSAEEAPKPLDPQLGTAAITPPPTIPDPSTLILRLLTPAEKEASWVTNSASWAGRLTQADYVAREAANGASRLLRDGGVRYWGLTTEGEGGEIYATVETLKKRVLVQKNESFNIEDTYGIASVFTPAKYRGHGLAGAMMRKLGEWLDTEEANCRFSVLFSDVGVRSHRPPPPTSLYNLTRETGLLRPPRLGRRPFPGNHPPRFSPPDLRLCLSTHNSHHSRVSAPLHGV